MLRFWGILTIFLLLPVFLPAAQSRQKQTDENYPEKRKTATNGYLQEREAATNRYRQEQNAAVERYQRERNAAIEKYQRVLRSSLGRNYSFEEDTSTTKALVESALRDDVKPENLVNAVKVLESGVKSGVKADDALDVAQLVQLENRKVSVEQTAAFSQARQIAKERNIDPGKADEALYNALRQDAPAENLVGIARELKAEPAPPQSSRAVSKTSWENTMKSKIQEFFTAKTPYVWGGNSISTGVDCSGFTTIVFDAIGMKIPRRSADQYLQGTKVSRENAKFGDMIFFYNDKKKGIIGHVGIVERINENGDVVFVHAANAKRGIARDVASNASYWGVNFAGIKRVVKN